MSEYPKIETLFERLPGGGKGNPSKVQPGVFKNRTYSLLKTWRWTEKIDGTNVRIIYTPYIIDLVACGESNVTTEDHPASIKIGGRTDNAVMPADLIQNILQQVTVEKMAAVFDVPVVLYGEGYGAGIQSGGGYSPAKKFILFDVKIGDKWWMNDEQVRDIGAKLGLDVVPLIGDLSIEEATEFVKQGFTTRLPGAATGTPAEGLVGRPLETLYDKKHSRLITKLKTKDF